MKISLVQFKPTLCNPLKNAKKINALIKESEHADLYILPELCNSGYNFSNRKEAMSSSSQADKHNIFIKSLVEISKTKNCGIVCGINERDKDKLFNSAVLISKMGIVGKYRKVHLFRNEKTIFEPGDLGFPVFKFMDAQIGMLVCFDWMFPEAWRILSMKGADLICHPSNLVLPGYAQKSLPAHAMNNGIFIATANRIGIEKELKFTGRSVLVNPKGEFILEGSLDSEQILSAEIQPESSRNKYITPENHIFEDRKINAYKELLN
ncbi:MAG: carbon-nitrogen hydrolase [Marinilabiliales bacterium]|nr:MAG: carbon-nitrogen hydrolase [Marinilabiliales bacterium]